MHGDPAADLDADRRHLAIFHPNACETGDPIALQSEMPKGVDEKLLKLA